MAPQNQQQGFVYQQGVPVNNVQYGKPPDIQLKTLFCDYVIEQERDTEEKLWYYLDYSKNVQGPINSIMMDYWNSMGNYFRDDLPLAFEHPKDFISMKEFFNKNKAQ